MEKEIINNNIAQVQQLLSSETHINAKYRYNQTALILSLEHGHSNMALQLLNIPNIDVNATGRFKQTALMIALKKGFDAVAIQMLNLPDIDVNAKSINGKTALMLSIARHNNTVSHLLIARKDIDLDTKDATDKTAMMLAAHAGYASTLRLLAKKLPNYNFQEADIYGHNILDLSKEDAIKYLIYSGKVLFKENDIFSETKTPIQILNNICNKHQINVYNRRFLPRILQDALPLPKLDTSKDSTTILLAAKVCGLSFTDNLTFSYTAMPMQKFKLRSSLMRIAALSKISHGFNLYMVMNMLLLRKPSKWLFMKLPKTIMANILDFLVGDHFDFSIYKSFPVNALSPPHLTTPTIKPVVQLKTPDELATILIKSS